MSAETLVVRLSLSDCSLELRVTPDPARARRAFAHGHGFAFEHTDRALSAPQREVVMRLQRSLARASSSGEQGVDVEALCARLAREIDPAGRSERVRSESASMRPRRFPWFLRVGAPRADALLPVDPESVALSLGLRRLIKREYLPLVDAERLAGEALGAGLGAALVAPPETSEPDAQTRTLLVARDAAVAAEGAERERRLIAHGARLASDEDADWIGAALGYPACCRARFLSLGQHDDASLLFSLLPPEPIAAPPYTGFATPLALVSHAPCRPDCEASISLGRALLAALDAARPGYAARWLAAMRSVTLLGGDGEALLAWGEGPLDGLRLDRVSRWEEMVAADVRARLPPAPSPPIAAGDRLRRRDEKWYAEGPSGEVAIALVADHRGPA